MWSATRRFVIVVGADFSALSARALDQALEAACCRDSAEVHVVHVEPESWIGVGLARTPAAATSPEVALQQLQERTSERVRALGDKLDGRRLKRVVVHFRRGAAAENIAQLAADLDADLVVVGSHGHRGIERLLLGSVAERVARLARCPVWIVRPKDHAAAGRVPEIEPPCPECVRRRQETGGGELWCTRHAEHHIRPHRYSYATHGVYAASSAPYQATPEGV